MSRAGSSKVTNGHQQKKKETKKKEELSSSDENDDEPIRAPIQLKIEVGKLIESNLIFCFGLVCQFYHVSSMGLGEEIMSFYVNVRAQ